jgi:sec-independent protein translocase protein TatA
LLIIAFILILLFGAKKVPELMKGMGEGIRGLKSGIEDKD